MTIHPGQQARYIDQGKWRFGTVLRVRRGGRTVEVKVGRRVVLVHPDRLHAVRVKTADGSFTFEEAS